ncbi:hypothetical protein BDN70DRAFT_923666 [Pholiota conissans]|uniref:F-box domain-containing protein n=1 Tax=Pholiota conissans TaxID=109636 RepID=A0A9P5YXQ7_9AGAR|nr:hypothetical protein BDN70DRAFT_923666 [Pholiota conissans]
MSASETPSMTPPSGNNLKLDHDILWIIFSIITSHYPSPTEPSDTLDAGPLTIIRRCSQVCSFWRDFILSSESIWAKCIGLDCLAQGNNDWRAEVLRRTGDVVPLQIFDVLLAYEKGLDDEKVLSAFSRPAPRLEEFSIRSENHSIDIWRPSVFSLPYFQLFSNIAPNLTRFCLYSHTYRMILPIQFRPFPLVLLTPRLRSLTIFERLSLSSADLLVICSQIPNLEMLHISIPSLEDDANTLSSSSRHVTLPRLHAIHIASEKLQIYPEFLGRIVTRVGCSVSVATRLDRSEHQFTDAGTRIFLDMLSLFQRHWNEYFDSRQHEDKSVVSIELSVFPRILDVKVNVHDHYHPRLYLKAPSRQEFPHETHNSVLNAISTLKFPTTLARAKISFISKHPQLNSDTLGRLCGALGSITKLSTTSLFLLRLSQATTLKVSDLFPFLKTISLYMEEAYYHDGATYIKPFFINRHSKAPIEILNIFDEHCRASLGNLEFLDELAGMKVIWRQLDIDLISQTSEYVCGSGRPEELDYFANYMIDFSTGKAVRVTEEELRLFKMEMRGRGR